MSEEAAPHSGGDEFGRLYSGVSEPGSGRLPAKDPPPLSEPPPFAPVAGEPVGTGWHRPIARPLPVRTVYAATAALSTIAVAHTLAQGVAEPRIALAFGVFVAVGETIRMTLPDDRTTAPLGAAGGLAYAVLADVAGRPTSHGALQVIAVVTVAMLAGMLPHLVVRRRTDPGLAARRVLTVAFTAMLFQPVFNGGLIPYTISEGPLFLCYLALVLALAGVCDAALAAVLVSARTGWNLGPFFRDELRARLGIGPAISATGVVMAVAAGVMGLWALPVFSVPLLLTQFAYRRYAAVRATYRQTIASLARATEIAGYTRPGHARRVTRLSRAIGRELGMRERELLMLEYAALMHDIGQLSLVDPVPSGATAHLPAEEQRRIARLGGEVVRQTGVPLEVAVMVERQADSFRHMDGRVDVSLPLASRIVRVANAYDDHLACGEWSPERSAAQSAGQSPSLSSLPYPDSIAPENAETQTLIGRCEAIQELRLTTSHEYDPRVVEALARICLRDGT